jgi:hypothetical protein
MGARRRRLLAEQASGGGLGVVLIACAPATPPAESADTVEVVVSSSEADGELREVPGSRDDAGAARLDDRPITWNRDTRASFERARRDGRPLLVLFRADWSAPSLELERTVLRDAAVARAVRPYVATIVDASGQGSEDVEYWTETLGVRGVPAIVITDAKLERRDRIDGVIEASGLIERLNAFVR